MEFQPYPEQPQSESLDQSHAPTPNAKPAPRPRKGCGFWLLALLAVIFLGTTLLLFFALVAIISGTADLEVKTVGTGPRAQFVEHTVKGKGDEKILLITVSGMITDMPYKSLVRSEPGLVSTVHDMLAVAREDEDVKAVILGIESPGGGITASDVLYHHIATFREATGLPVVALLGDVAASGAYYVACSSEYIVAHPTTVTGSIGVIMPLIGIENLLQKIGVEPRPIKSGEMKDIGTAYRSMTEKEKRMLQEIVDEYLERFLSVVAEGFERRGISKPRSEIERHCDGRVFTGNVAREIGFVDEIGYFDTAVAAARKLAGLSPEKTRVVAYRRKPGLLDIIWGRASTPHPEAVTIRLEGLLNRESPRFLYLWTVGERHKVSAE